MDIPKYARLKSFWGYMKMADEIIEELWRIKDAIANEYGCDLKALVTHSQAKKQEEHRQVVHLQSIKPTAEPAAQPEPASSGESTQVAHDKIRFGAVD
jgi:hypothetical protein